MTTGARVHNLTSFFDRYVRCEKKPRHCLNNDGTIEFHNKNHAQWETRIVQALASQGISIALGCAFTTRPADHLIVSPRSRGSNLRDKNPIPVVTSPTEIIKFFYLSYCSPAAPGMSRKSGLFMDLS